MKYFHKIIAAIVIGIVTTMNGTAMDSKSEYITTMDPPKIAAHETAVWKLYYGKEYDKAGVSMKAWVEGAFGIPDAKDVTPLFIQTMALFGQIPQDSKKEVYQLPMLPLLETLFSQINRVSIFNFQDPAAAAQKELDWWVARRFKDELNPENVGTIMAEVYANLYGGLSQHYEKATYLRAAAARYRDLSQDKWGGSRDSDWAYIEVTLTQSYTELKKVLAADVKE
jgi:hypothetical protein